MFSTAELHEVKVDPIQHAFNVVYRLTSKHPDEQRLSGCLPFTLDGVGARFQDFDSRPEFTPHRTGDFDVNPPGRVGEDHADQIRTCLAGPDGMFDGAH